MIDLVNHWCSFAVPPHFGWLIVVVVFLVIVVVLPVFIVVAVVVGITFLWYGEV